MRCYLDTTIALRAASDLPESDVVTGACRRLIHAIGNGHLDADMANESILEVLQATAWQAHRPRGLTLGEQLLRLFPHPLQTTREALGTSIALMRANPRVGPRTAIHAAIMRQAGLDTVVSLDDAFGLISGIRRLSPEDACRDLTP